MEHRCFIRGCRGSYDNGPRVRVFSFPADEELKKIWIHVIPQQNQKITKSSKVSTIFKYYFYNLPRPGFNL